MMFDMGTGPAEDFAALHERVLTFIGAFSSTQFAIDSIVGMYLRRQLPSLGKELDKQFLDRIKDEQRLPLFKAFAAEVNYALDVPVFSTIYNRAKQVRDMVGHSHWIGGPVWPAGVVEVASTVSKTKTTLVPSPLFPSTFTHLKADCDWLIQHVNRAGFEGKACDFITGDGQPYEPPTPLARPTGGEPLR
jgi:hypothetical protein